MTRSSSTTDWRVTLADAVEAGGSRWSVGDLQAVVAGSSAGLVDVVGWLSDELRVGHMQHTLVWPHRYERVPGLPSQRHRIAR